MFVCVCLRLLIMQMYGDFCIFSSKMNEKVFVITWTEITENFDKLYYLTNKGKLSQ